MNVALIGTGSMTKRLLEAAEGQVKDMEFSAAFSRNKDRRAEFQKRYPSIQCAESFEGILDDPAVEAVYIATPVDTHADLTVRALEAGKHVLCEKPMAMNRKECERMIKKAKEQDRILQIAYMMRFHPIHQYIRGVIESGELGRIRFVHVERTALIDFTESSMPEYRKWFVRKERSGGGVFWDLGSHLIDLLLYILGREPESWNLTALPDERLGLETDAAASFLFSDQTKATLLTSWNIPLHDNIIQVYGEKASLMANRSIGPYHDGRLELITDTRRSQIFIPYKSHYVAELEHFRDCITAESEPLTSGRHVLPSEVLRMEMYNSLDWNG
jgi:predicted dehydrogenase